MDLPDYLFAVLFPCPWLYGQGYAYFLFLCLLPAPPGCSLAGGRHILRRRKTRMARTPLLQALQRMASEHAEADERGVSLEEVRHERQLRLSRRDLLKGAGTLAAGIALADPLNLAGRFMKAEAASKLRIGIVGAGIAGLTAALTLQDAGYTSTV